MSLLWFKYKFYARYLRDHSLLTFQVSKKQEHRKHLSGLQFLFIILQPIILSNIPVLSKQNKFHSFQTFSLEIFEQYGEISEKSLN